MEIIEILKKNNVSVKELSKNTGIPEPRIYKWYANKVNPKTNTFLKVLLLN